MTLDDWLRAVLESPDDPALLGPFADWLEEQGDERAASVRREGGWFITTLRMDMEAGGAKQHMAHGRRSDPCHYFLSLDVYFTAPAYPDGCPDCGTGMHTGYWSVAGKFLCADCTNKALRREAEACKR